jgi:hypothetical protein
MTDDDFSGQAEAASLRPASLQPAAQSFMTAGFSPAAPLPPQILSDRRLSVTIQGHFGAVQTRDKSWLVHVPPTGCTITTVASTSTDYGSCINIPGDQTADIHLSKITLPYAVVPGDALVVFSEDDGTNTTPAYWNAPTGSDVDEAMAVVFVSYPVHEGLYRPPAIGRRTNPIVKWLRDYPIYESAARMSKLPRVYRLDDIYQIPGTPRPGDAERLDPTVTDGARPTWASLVARLGGEFDSGTGRVLCGGRFAGDVYGEWRVADRCPWTQHGGYGRNYADGIGNNLMILCANEDQGNKVAIAHALVQRGLDDFARIADGMHLKADGGHMWGRRASITLAGHLFGADWLSDPTWLGEHTPEDNGFPFGKWWFGGSPAWTVRYPNNDGTDAFFANPPSTWGNPAVHGTPMYMLNGYMAHKMPSMLKHATALALMGCEKYAPKLVQAVRQHQERPPAAAMAQMTAAGANSDVWARSYGPPVGWAALVWHRYVRGLSGLPTP